MGIMQETYGLDIGDKIVYNGVVYVIMEDDNGLMPLVQDEKGENHYFDLTEFEWERYKEQTNGAQKEFPNAKNLTSQEDFEEFRNSLMIRQ